MRKTMHIWPEEPTLREGRVTVSSIIEVAGKETKKLWYKIPENNFQDVSSGCDHFAIGAVFQMMNTGTDVHVHGQISPSLLRNLNEFQSAWVAMRPDLVKVAISADLEQEDDQPTQSDQAIMAFSGGVDSCFTAYRHTRLKDERFPRNLTAGLMVHGFDIPLDNPEAIALATEGSKRILSSLGLELITVATNYREVIGEWIHSHGAAIASCLYLFRKRFSEGLIGQTFTYGELKNTVEGVNALTDPLLSSNHFKIVPDGAAFKRADKILAIGNSPEILKDLRVCWEGPQKYRNCCNCEKCMRNILTFRALGLGLPPCFEHDISPQQISTLRMGDRTRRTIRYESLLSLAKKYGNTGIWINDLARRLAADRRIEDSKFLPIYLRAKRLIRKMLK